MEGYHRPVLLREVLESLKILKGNWYIDATLGDGGHALEVLKQGGKVLGIDVDPNSLKRAEQRFKNLGINKDQYRLIRGNFRNLKDLLQTDLASFSGIIFDLGVSSLQLLSPERGFSFMNEGPLDMRMDPSLEVRASDLINVLNKGELNELFSKLGEEKYSKSLAEAVVSTRKVKAITTTKQLAEIAQKVKGKKSMIHPATLIFQALRIAVNDELHALQEALPQALEALEQKGRVVTVSFHSLEDRIVKNTFKDWQARGLGQIITKKPIRPADDEIRNNPRSRSAKLRVFEKS